MSIWKRFRYRLEWVGVTLFAAIVPLLPRRTCAGLAKFVGSVAYVLDGKGRAVALANLEAAFGDTYSNRERRRIARASVQNFTRTIFDLFWTPRITRDNYRQYMRIEGWEDVVDYWTRKPAALGLTHHFGNFEWANLSTGYNGQPVHFVAQEFKNPLLGPIFNGLREIPGTRLIPRRGALIQVFKKVKAGQAIGMVADLTLRPGRSSVIIDTFGMKMCVTSMPAEIHRRTGAPLVPGVSYPLGNGTCRLIFYQPIEADPDASTAEIAQACWDYFEKHIRKAPELWLWSYKHWRYKPAAASRPYPFYANVSSAFDERLREQEHDSV